MLASQLSLAPLLDEFRLEPGDLILLHDELDLPAGKVRVKLGGNENGHNGLKSITKSLGGKPYNKVAVGIGRPPGRMAPADYVLKPFSAKEQMDLAIASADAADEILRAIG